jgi:hypothetical protein
VNLNQNGSFTYVPAEGFVGLDNFAYRVTNRRGNSAVATVAIIVNGPAASLDACYACFASFDSVLWRRSNAFRAIMPVRLAVSTNTTCPTSSVLLFGALAKSLVPLNDAEANAALDSSAQCLSEILETELKFRLEQAGSLSPSKFTRAASNQIAVISRNIERAMASSNNMVRAKAFATAAKSLPRIDRTLAAGDLAPALVIGRTFTCDIFQGRTRSQMKLFFGAETFVAEDMAGTPLFTGSYGFSRTAWNQGSLSLTLDNPGAGLSSGETMSLQLRFSRGRGRLTGPGLRGYFTVN